VCFAAAVPALGVVAMIAYNMRQRQNAEVGTAGLKLVVVPKFGKAECGFFFTTSSRKQNCHMSTLIYLYITQDGICLLPFR